MLRLAIWSSLRELRDQGRTLLITTQYVADAEYCNRVVLLAEGRMVAIDEPEALRRSAYGGDVLRIETDRAVDPEALTDVAGLPAVQLQAPRRLVAVTDDAGSASPRVVEALRRQGIGVASVEEYQPSYDEAFAVLVQRQRDGRARQEAADATDEPRDEAGGDPASAAATGPGELPS
jgi:ABC-2 type transport system ATP-binding protein